MSLPAFNNYLYLYSVFIRLLYIYSAAWIDKCRPDILISESTYATTIRDSKRCRERDFLKKVHESIERGGKVKVSYVLHFTVEVFLSYEHAFNVLFFYTGSNSCFRPWKSTGTLHPAGNFLVGLILRVESEAPPLPGKKSSEALSSNFSHSVLYHRKKGENLLPGCLMSDKGHFLAHNCCPSVKKKSFEYGAMTHDYNTKGS